MTDLKTSLIEEMESVKNSAPTHPRGVGYNEGLDTAIEIIRNHQPVQVAPTTLEVLRQARAKLKHIGDAAFYQTNTSEWALIKLLGDIRKETEAAITAIDKVLGKNEL